MTYSGDIAHLVARFTFIQLGPDSDGWWLGICPFCTHLGNLNPKHLLADRLQRELDCSAQFNFDRGTWKCVSPDSCNYPKKAGTIPGLLLTLDAELPNWRAGG